jgi:hypothetical protein
MRRGLTLLTLLCAALLPVAGRAAAPSLDSLAPAAWTGFSRVEDDPQQIIGAGISHAAAAAGFGYAPQASQTFLAGALVIRTSDHLPYDHNIKTCRLNSDGALFTGSTTLSASGAYFPAYFTQAGNGNEVSTSFVAWTLADGQIVIDSRHLATDYPAVPGAVDSVTVQLWAVNQPYLIYMLKASLALWAAQGQITFNNVAQPHLPLVMIQRASHFPNTLTLQVMNYSGQSQPVTITVERYLTTDQTATPDLVTQSVTVEPGPSTVHMAVDSFIGADIYTGDATGARDQAYLGRAFQYFTDKATGGTSSVIFGTTACASGKTNTLDTLLLSPGCATLDGTVQQYSGIYLPMGSYVGEVVSLNGQRVAGIEFWAKSETPFRVEVEDVDVHDDDYHGMNLPASPAWTKYDIAFKDLTQRGFGVSEPFDGQVLNISWLVPPNVQPANAQPANFDMVIDSVAFTKEIVKPVVRRPR